MDKKYEPVPCPTCGHPLPTGEKRRVFNFSKADKSSWDYTVSKLGVAPRVWVGIIGGFIVIAIISAYLFMVNIRSEMNHVAAFFGADNPADFWMFTSFGVGIAFMLVASWRIHRFKKRLRNDKKNLLLKYGWEGEKEGEYVVK